jgi:hypothetical protein
MFPDDKKQLKEIKHVSLMKLKETEKFPLIQRK